MSDILIKLWMNIDNFNYKRVDMMTVDEEDMERLNKSHRRFLFRPITCLVISFIISRSRNKMWARLKEFLYKDRVYNVPKEKPVLRESGKLEAPKVEFTLKSEAERNLEKNSFMALRKKRKFSIEEEITSNMRIEPTVSEEYLKFIPQYKSNIRKLSFFKKYFKKLTDKNIVNKGENFILTTKLIYIPFIIVLFLSTYELAVTYLGLYLKYQPLIDEYFQQNINKNI
jgi:hypothetical protein